MPPSISMMYRLNMFKTLFLSWSTFFFKIFAGEVKPPCFTMFHHDVTMFPGEVTLVPCRPSSSWPLLGIRAPGISAKALSDDAPRSHCASCWESNQKASPSQHHIYIYLLYIHIIIYIYIYLLYIHIIIYI